MNFLQNLITHFILVQFIHLVQDKYLLICLNIISRGFFIYRILSFNIHNQNGEWVNPFQNTVARGFRTTREKKMWPRWIMFSRKSIGYILLYVNILFSTWKLLGNNVKVAKVQFFQDTILWRRSLEELYQHTATHKIS